MWEYPPEILAKLKPISEEQREKSKAALAARHAETLARIDSRITGEKQLAEERRLALEWCRNNGNPHKPKI